MRNVQAWWSPGLKTHWEKNTSMLRLTSIFRKHRGPFNALKGPRCIPWRGWTKFWKPHNEPKNNEFPVLNTFLKSHKKYSFPIGKLRFSWTFIFFQLSICWHYVDLYVFLVRFWSGRRPLCGGVRGGGSPPGCCLIYSVNSIPISILVYMKKIEKMWF